METVTKIEERQVSPLPRAAFAISPSARAGVFPRDLVARLQELVDIDPAATFRSFSTPEERAALAEVEILLTGWGAPRLDQTVLDHAPRLRAVIHAAGTVKKLVDPEVFARGILVSSATAANAVPVAEYTMALLVLAAKQALARSRWYAGGQPAGDWRSGTGTGLHGRAVGILGASTIGRLVLERLQMMRQRYDLRLLLSDPYVTPAEARLLGVELVEVDGLFRRSELLSLHAPALPETRHLVNEARLALLPDGATLINTARGSIVDTEALLRHCAEGRISAILDVTEPEVLPANHPLFVLPNVMVTPHLAGAQGRDLRCLGLYAVDEIERLVGGYPLRGTVRARDLSRIA